MERGFERNSDRFLIVLNLVRKSENPQFKADLIRWKNGCIGPAELGVISVMSVGVCSGMLEAPIKGVRREIDGDFFFSF